MAAYLRIDGLDPDDLDQADHDLFGDLANDVFYQIRADHPDLYEDLEGVIPVRNVERDPRLLETSPVYAHVEETVDEDVVRCSFDDPETISELDAPGSHATDATSEALIQLTLQVADTGDDQLDDKLWREFTSELSVAGDDHAPVRVGTLYHDREQVVRVDFNHLNHDEEAGA